jgi:IMP dehydrogenase
MAHYYPEPSHTFNEYLLIPNLTAKSCTPATVTLHAPLTRFKRGEAPAIRLNIPFASAIMQAVSDHEMAIALARSGGISFIFVSQPIERQAEMVDKVKRFKAGFVQSDSNLKPDHTLRDVLAIREKTGHRTVAVTEDGSPTGRLLGILTSRDYRLGTTPLETRVSELMTKSPELVYGEEGMTLKEANDIIWKRKLNCLPVVMRTGGLSYLVFRKDYAEHKQNPNELVDGNKRLVVGAGINSRDYTDRVPALVSAGADALCIDSSDGFSEWQSETISWIKGRYGDAVKVGAGNVVDAEGFRFLADAGADFVKVGIGGGSICITR